MKPSHTSGWRIVVSLLPLTLLIAFITALFWVIPTPVPITETATSVVQIRSLVQSDGGMAQVGSGSGVVVDTRGYVLTCDHVVDGVDQVMVDVGGFLSRATVIASDPYLDLALLRVDRGFSYAAPWGSSSALSLGDTVIAIGFPFDVAKLVRRGVVSSIDYNIECNPFIITDAQINPGDSGGAVFNSSGELVGISARIQTSQGLAANIGIAYAIPSEVAHWFVNHHLPLPTKE